MAFYCATIYGLGASMLDPAGGMDSLRRRIGSLGIEVPAQPFDESNIEVVLAYLKGRTETLMLVGDSCGANRAPWLAAALHPRKIAYMACIQASIYCNAGCPRITDNVEYAHVFYSDFAHTLGLGTYIPHCEHLPNNHGMTHYQQSYVPAFHPDDNDVLRIQNPILEDIKQAMSK